MMMRPRNVNSLILIVNVLSQGWLCEGQASGNAIDLANMNMHLMSTKCAITPCQSACLVRQPNTGCYVCNPTCGAGNTGIAMPGFAPTANSQGLYGCGAGEGSWARCPVTCLRTYDHRGCFRCDCQQMDLGAVTNTSPKKTTVSPANPTRRPFDLAAPVHETPSPVTTSTASVQTTLHHSTSTADGVDTTTHTDRTTAPKTSQITTEQTTTRTSTFAETTSRPVSSTQVNSDVTTTRGVTHTSTNKHLPPQSLDLKPCDRLNFKLNTLSFILISATGCLLFSTLIFLYAWRKALGKLRRNKDELYFVHKAYRQDSNARLWQNDQLDPVYAEMTPDPPPRQLPEVTVIPSAPIRGTSVSSQVTVGENPDDSKHDYLELI